MGNFLAKQIKDQTDSILRRRQVSPGSSMTVRGGTTTPGTGPGGAPEVVEPNRDLDRHRSSADHDGRYYTEDEIDALLNFLGLSDTPEAYEGQAGKILAVKSTADGLEFVSAPPATNGIPTGGANNQLLAKDGTADYAVKWVNAPEAANGIPAGGTANQILAKIDSTNYNAQWIDAPSGGAGYQNPIDEPPASPSAWDDEFNGSSLDAKWSWANQGTAAATFANGSIMIDFPAASEATRGIVQAVPSGDFTAIAKVSLIPFNNISYASFGVGVYNSSGGKSSLIGRRTAGATRGFSYVKTLPTSNVAGAYSMGYGQETLYVKVIKTATDYTFYISFDGAIWFQYFTEAISTWIGAITHVGLFGWRYDNTASRKMYGICDWFRIVEVGA